MGRFSIKGQFPILELKFEKGPFAFIKGGGKNLTLIKIKPFLSKFVITDDAAFELDSEYEHKILGKAFYLFNIHNSKPNSLIAIEEIQRLYRNDYASLVTEIENVNKAVEESKVLKNTIKLMKVLESRETKPKISRETIKFLIDSKIFDPSDTDVLLADSLIARTKLPQISKSMGTQLPLLIFSCIGIFLVIIVKMLPTWLHWF